MNQGRRMTTKHKPGLAEIRVTVAGATAPPPRAAGRWQAERLLSAPHRLAFFAGAVTFALTALWWLAMLNARAFGWPVPWAVAPAAAHGLALALAFMPLFMTGFLFTAGTRWLGLSDVPARTLLRPLLAMAGGWALALPGFHFAVPLAGLGLALVTLGWVAVLRRFVRLIALSRVPDRLHARAVAVAGAIGALAMGVAAVAVAIGQTDLARAATQLAIWGFLAPVFAIVSHRMLPFFTASALPFVEAWRPDWLLAVMLWMLGITALAEVGAVLWWPLPSALHAALALLQWPVGGWLLWLALRWGLLHSLKVRLLAMLHGGFVWLGVAFALAATSHALVAWRGEAASLGLAPLHALTMGYLGATLIAMITRVTAGHSGRPLAADNVVWALYLVLQAAAVLRVVAALWPALPFALTVVAAAGWAVACAGWAWRYGGWLGRPRADGRAD
jgi:uncharacterized protein involved in response to NO